MNPVYKVALRLHGQPGVTDYFPDKLARNNPLLLLLPPPLLLPPLLMLLLYRTNNFAVDCVATCEADLTDIWQGVSGDILSEEFRLTPSSERAASYPSGYTGVLRLTLVAARALANLKQQCHS
jgi:hypothetical protein